MIDGLKGNWNEIFEHNLPSLQRRLKDEITRTVNDAIKKFKDSVLSVSPELGDLFDPLEQNWQRLLAQSLTNTEEALSSFRVVAKRAWRLPKSVIETRLPPCLAEAALLKGKWLSPDSPTYILTN